MIRRLIILLLIVGCEKSIKAGNVDSNLPNSIIFKNIPAGTFTMGGTTMQNDAPMVGITL